MIKKMILDCYTDEPSGLGAPPYLSVHSRYIAGSLSSKGEDYIYITIDDLRFYNGEQNKYIDSNKKTWNKRILNQTKNKLSEEVLNDISEVYVVFGCFINYDYVSCEPPTFKELAELCKKYLMDKNIILFYALGANVQDINKIDKLQDKDIFSEIIVGNTYNYFYGHKNSFLPYYEDLKMLSVASASIIKHLQKPVIYEIETATGCNRKPGCSFCIENLRNVKNVSREINDIVEEIKSLYSKGARHFRLGRQPNFYSYHHNSSVKINELLKTIKERCPNILTLHIDNVNPQDVVTYQGELTTKYIAENCTAGNIGPFGVESFDENVRRINNLNGSNEDIINAINIFNKYGNKIGNNGLRVYLPGINLIYGLPGQNVHTLQINLRYLKQILDSGNLVRRVFVRKLTSPQGTSLDKIQYEKNEFDMWKKTIEEEFSLPMLKKVYPLGTIVKNARVEMFLDGQNLLRVLGTCSERIFVKCQEFQVDDIHNVRIIGYRNSRELIGEIFE